MQDQVLARSWWRRPCMRISVRALIAFIVIVGCGLGWIVHRARVQRDAVVAIERANGSIRYDWQLRNGRSNPNGAPWGPKWLVDRIGVDYFGNVISVAFTMRRSHVALAHIRQLGRLETLIVSSSKVTDADLAHLDGLTGLRDVRLDLRGAAAGVTDAGLAHLEGLTGVRDLDLTGTQVTDVGMTHLKGLTGLQRLNLLNTRITDAGLAHLAGLKNLRVLVVADVRVSDAGLAHLEGLRGLQVLDMGRTRISDSGLAHLKGLKGLQTLVLSHTQVTDVGIEKLQRALPEVTIR